MDGLSQTADTALIVGVFSVITLWLNHRWQKPVREKAEKAEEIGRTVAASVGTTNGHGTLSQMVEQLLAEKNSNLEHWSNHQTQISHISSRLGTTETMQLAHERSIHDLRTGQTQLDKRVTVVERLTKGP